MRESRAGGRSRERCVRAAILLVSALLLLQCSASPPPRNLVMIVVDTLRADALSLYGQPREASPHLDDLGRDSVVFDHAWAQGTFTPASFISYMTSTHVRTHGWDFHLAYYPDSGVCGWDDLETLSEVLSRHGFRSEALVANPALRPTLGFARGFASWNGVPLDRGQRARVDAATVPRLTDRAVVRGARAAMERWDASERHFLYLHLMAPHLPLEPSPAALESLGLPGDWAPEGRIDLTRIRELRKSSTAPDREATRIGYRASVWDADELTGAILSTIGELGHRDDTVVVFLSDHGEEIWEHGDYGHIGSIWEQLAHVPLAIRVPGRPPGRVGDRAVALVDLAPTLLDLFGIDERPGGWQGENLFDAAPGRPVFTERFRVVGVTTDGRLKGVYGPEGGWQPDWSYYDLERDPTEQKRLERAPGGDELRAAYDAWVLRTPRVERDLEADPVGLCDALTDEERDRREEALRALGYIQ
jgi:arylsulfatase A-like enzyme